MFNDPQFWVLVSFIIFVGIVFVFLRKMILTSLDNKIAEIKNRIDEAEKIKNEAQQALSEINKRQNDVKKEIELIQNESKEKINFLELQFNEKLAEQINKKENLTNVKIEQMTREANTQVQKYIVDTAIKATIQILEKKLDENEKQSLINQSIKELNSTLKN